MSDLWHLLQKLFLSIVVRHRYVRKAKKVVETTRTTELGSKEDIKDAQNKEKRTKR